MKTVSFYTQGCRLNQAETASLEQSFIASGFTILSFGRPTDIVVVNTCTVTEGGDSDTRRLVNKINRINPLVKIALIGCQSQILKSQLLRYQNVTWVVGNQEKMNLSDIIKRHHHDEPQLIVSKIKREPFTIKRSGIDRHHTRANLKIQDGCDFYCSFCTIPFARGPARSRVFDDILKEAHDLLAAGHQELVITGINVGTYSDDGKNIVDVVHALLALTGLKRLRISSIEPTTIPKSLIYLMRDHPKLCRYLHIPLQAGSDPILQAMNRHYRIAEFREFIQFAYETVPDICIGTDIIVGFPGEDKGCFDQTVANLMTMPIHYFHVFSYSERQMARSKKLSDQVPAVEIAARSKQLRDLSLRKKAEFYNRFKGQSVSVLFESQKSGKWGGYTDNFLKVQVQDNYDLSNQFRDCYVTDIANTHISATIV